MCNSKDFQKWIQEVMSKIIEKLGLDADEVRYKLLKSTDRMMTSIHFVVLRFKDKTKGEDNELSIVLKRPLQERGDMGEYSTRDDSQFHNEILFYQTYARPDENYARCIYANEGAPSDSVIALEDVTKRGYHLCPHKYYAPLEYVLAVVREIGRFHGKGYAMKELQPEKFFDIVSRLQEVRYFNTSMNMYKDICNIYAPRAVEYLRRQGYDTVFCDKMEAVLANAFDEVMMKMVEPLEPLSTLCHGDVTLDNILFGTKNDGQVRAMLIDFALLRYSTPVIDLSTYLHIGCPNELRKDKFLEIMRAYHDELKKYLLEAGVWNIEKYSYEAILDDYKRGGLFGFVIASLYMSILLGYFQPNKQDFITIGLIKYVKQHKYDGGDELCKMLADMLLHLRDLGCLKDILE
ncbi:uncharacterized protein LOC105429712 [Pogonomyrmex barbatus]|uniref:Uncharacterized protein LOC105429712 n=1 Tax=Pogonomyrmex barbatus TaxID=144034 RepID=A0A6I9WF47_9HYME|nr:uncharacterized protein LOC105429712 [Pogonomyrmex barbatus]